MRRGLMRQLDKKTEFKKMKKEDLISRLNQKHCQKMVRMFSNFFDHLMTILNGKKF